MFIIVIVCRMISLWPTQVTKGPSCLLVSTGHFVFCLHLFYFHPLLDNFLISSSSSSSSCSPLATTATGSSPAYILGDILSPNDDATSCSARRIFHMATSIWNDFQKSPSVNLVITNWWVKHGLLYNSLDNTGLVAHSLYVSPCLVYTVWSVCCVDCVLCGVCDVWGVWFAMCGVCDVWHVWHVTMSALR